MTRSELINQLYLSLPHFQKEDVDVTVRHIIDQMEAALGRGERIEIRGFGAFSLRHHEAKQGRNPKTGEIVEIPEKHTVHFRPGKALKERVDYQEG